MVKSGRDSLRLIVLLGAAAVLSLAASCAFSSGTRVDVPQKAYVAAGDESAPAGDMGLFARYAPIVVIQTYADPHNRVGSVAAELNDDGEEAVYVDAGSPTFYVQAQHFETPKGSYVNLIYRLQFEGVPGLRLTHGSNVGIFVVETLNAAGEPVLVTTVHTCGCYLAFCPTSYTPQDACPDGWSPSQNDVYGERLPGRLIYPPEFSDRYRPVVFLRDGTHRVMDVRVEDVGEAAWRYDVLPAAIRPMDMLRALPLDGHTTSFFYTQGSRKGYVKGSRKPFEMLLMGWWALDFYVGRDKDLGDRDATGVTFYTSLKPWARTQSDMGRFADFLRYWGWRL